MITTKQGTEILGFIMALFNMNLIFSPANMIAQSQSGTGKTAAFVLTMLSRVDTSLNYPQVMNTLLF